MNDFHTLRKVQPDPAVIKNREGRIVKLVDDGVMAPARGEMPADEPAPDERIQIGPLDV